eukprot:Phypoly_transcript_06583.p1 GENE.Phypoly_transcript_06583~~Phypoly_transcript_06583.p1  ORF type:complete len:539 (+),score=79.01 Phypoly_transcript_06583:88-1704(+)
MGTRENIISLKDLPSDVLADIFSQVSLECVLKIGLTDTFWRKHMREREPEFKDLLERDFYSCYLFKQIIDTHGYQMMSSLKGYQNKSWFSLFVLASRTLSKDEKSQELEEISEPKNEEEEEGKNIVYGEDSFGTAPLAYLENYSSHKELKGATVNILIQKILLGEIDTVYQTSLISSFDCFIALESLLKIIIHKFYHFTPFAQADPNLASKKVALGQSVLQLLRRLIVRRANAFQARHLRMVAKFAQEITGHEIWGPQALLIWKALAQELVKLILKPPTNTVEGPVSSTPLIERSPKILAQQLSLFVFRLYSEFSITDVIDFKKPPNFGGGAWKAFVECFNKISSWVAAHILGTRKLKERVKIFQFFVEVAQHLFSHHDYHSLSAVLSAFSSSAVYRLKFTREAVSSKHQTELQALEKAMELNTNNSKTFRTLLATTQPPCVPFLGIYYQDMSHMLDRNPSLVLKDNLELVNCWKLRMCNKILSDALIFQSTKYTFPEEYEYQVYIGRKIMLKEFTEQVLFENSLKREPRGCNKSNLE